MPSSCFFKYMDMNNYGFIRTAAAVPSVRVADTAYNTDQILSLTEKAAENQVSITVFPELCITGSTCGDLFRQTTLIKGAEEGVRKLAGFSSTKKTTIVVGAPVSYGGRLYDCGIVISKGEILGIVPKVSLAQGQDRIFSSGEDFLSGETWEIRYAGQKCTISPKLQFKIGDAVVAVEVGEDLWSVIPQSCGHALSGVHITAHPSAENEILMTLRAAKKDSGNVLLSDCLGCDDDGNEMVYGDILGYDDDEVESRLESEDDIKKMLLLMKTSLSDMERTVLELRYGITKGSKIANHDGLTQQEVADRLNISRSYVSRIETRALGKLAKKFGIK